MRKQANKNMEFITPVKIRKWLAEKINSKYENINSVFDPAVGSGQLFHFVKSEKYIGCDINLESIKCFEENFSNCESYKTNYFETDIKNYDIAISNYPFSLNFKDLVDKIPVELEQFYNKKITGKADFPFILRSFLKSEKGGFYLCYPGISYRSQEQQFRDFLINSNYVVSYGILKNCKFDATNINILYLELSKNKINDVIETFCLDFESGEEVKKSIYNYEVLNDVWMTPEFEKEKETIDINEIEKEIEKCKLKRRKVEDELDKFIYNTFKKREKEVEFFQQILIK